ncbi:IclR family transcriptional regulator [Brevundimonas sp. SL130]|uniref:IclR family transcriptional regulator n=1 Tax=Brevundimonas sp. SL130 TaxID=2995143 RepID=UPI00226D3BCE|nr:IclR family transcriptional regulator [Brevundimonas sp. SL130]WAC60765.1 IclR family transcriptional regulator [Brevundimonas sp. SL130]
MAESERRQGIQSVGIGLRVLDVLAAQEGAQPLGVIALAADLSPSQAHRYLASLVAAGMARQEAASGHYDLGPAALRLGLGALTRIDAFHEANLAITEFARETGRTVQMASLGPTGPIVVRWAMGSPPVATSLMVGSALPLLRSATGHVFLAFRHDSHTRHLIARETAEDRGLEPVDVEGLRKRVRADGYSAVSGSLIPGLRATAVPIFDLQEEAVMTATVLATSAFKPELDDSVRDQLIAVCDRVTAAIGGRRPVL